MGAVGSNLRCSIEGAPSGLIYGPDAAIAATMEDTMAHIHKPRRRARLTLEVEAPRWLIGRGRKRGRSEISCAVTVVSERRQQTEERAT